MHQPYPGSELNQAIDELADCPFSPEYLLLLPRLQSFLREAVAKFYSGHYFLNFNPGQMETGRALLESAPKEKVAFLHLVTEFMAFPITAVPSVSRKLWGAFQNLGHDLLKQDFLLSAEDLARLFEETEENGGNFFFQVMERIERNLKPNELTPALRESLTGWRRDNPMRAQRLRITQILGDAEFTMPDAVEPWAESAHADLANVPAGERRAWETLFGLCQQTDGGKPTPRWIADIDKIRQEIGEAAFVAHILRWLPLVTLPPAVEGRARGTSYIAQIRGSERNTDILRGLAWACADREEPEIARTLAKMVEGCLKKAPGVGPWAIRAANAGVYALSKMPCPEAVAQLGRLKTRVTFRTTLNLIEKALEQAAARAGVTKEELEDLAVQDYGLDADGTRREIFGDFVATLTLSPGNGDVSLTWEKADKPLKSVPAEVKKIHADQWKAFKADADGVAQTVSAQRERLDRAMFPVRTWTLGAWRERYLNHPILGSLSRRLLWQIAEGERVAAVLPSAPPFPPLMGGGGGQTNSPINGGGGATVLLDVDGQAVEGFTDAATVQLWHPITATTEEVLRWRGILETRGIVQPFKQAHREIYLLTDAERNTRTYSNRYAGHIIKQHQFNQLCALRGWKNKLRLMVDDEYPPATRELPEYNLRAEFWIEGVGDDYGNDTTDSGTYLRLSTDQVRFYPLNARPNSAHAHGGGYEMYRWGGGLVTEPIPVEEIPALPFSEIMRDVDMFVGVASVGNDPTWQDGGPQGRFRDYWQDYSFGDLSESAKTRAEVLAKLLPRLKIADRTRLDGKFLTVRGDLRTYKIHLGSGNILMEPNDQYLCIVQNRSLDPDGTLFLPFEGDTRLSLILSKAFLLADDKKITDTTITRQIKL